MPSRPLRACAKAGCVELVTSGYCDCHKALLGRVYDNHRGSAASRGYDSDWQHVRLDALKRDCYLCVICLTKGIVTPARDVDHITSITTAPELRLVLDNLQSLCRACHVTKTNIDRKASNTPDASSISR
jgi:5-methylcytosine-specific restriction protein A